VLTGNDVRAQLLEADDFIRNKQRMRETWERTEQQRETIQVAEALKRMMATEGWTFVESLITRFIDVPGMMSSDPERQSAARARSQVANELLGAIYTYVKVGDEFKAKKEEVSQKAEQE